MGGLVSVFILPLMLLNFFGGIISGIWLAVLGQWWAIGYGIVSLFVSHFALGFVLMPGLVFGGPAGLLLNKGKLVLAFPLLLLSQLYTYLVITVWCMLVFHLFMHRATYASYWPLLIWSYGVALGPWMYMAKHDSQAGNSASTTTTFFAQIAYIVVAMITVFGRPTLLDLATVFAVIMLIGMIIQTTVGMLEATAYQRRRW